MKTPIRTLLCACALALAAAPALAADKTPDARVRRALNAEDLSFTTNDSGNFRLIMPGDSGDRTQLLFVNSNTQTYREREIREVWSVAYAEEGNLSKSRLMFLLKDNAEKKWGFWQLLKEDEKTYVVFQVELDADCDSETLADAVRLVARAADKLEEDWDGGDDR